jgi:hypothetical protein
MAPYGGGIFTTTESNSKERAQSTLVSAFAYALRGLRANEEGNGSDRGERAGQEWRLLKRFCASQNLVVPNLPLEPGGSEHDAAIDPVSRHWLKFTKPNRCGWVVEVDEDSCIMLPASPMQYLARWMLSNHLFNDDAEFVGVVKREGEGSRLVVSQRHIEGEGPSWYEIEDHFVNQKRFRRIDPPGLDSCGGYHARAYWFGRYAVFDVRPPNCIRTETGEIVPIDVIPIVCSRAAATYLSQFVVL